MPDRFNRPPSLYSATTPAALITAAHLAISPGSQAASSAGRAQRQRHALRGDGFRCGLGRQRGGDRAVKLFNCRRGRLRRGKQREPCVGLDAGHARFRERRQVRQPRRALGLATASARSTPDSMYDDARQGREGEIDAAGQQLGGHRRRAAERDVLQVDAGPGLEQLRREMRGRADAGRGVVQFAGRFLRERAPARRRSPLEPVPHHQHMRDVGDAGDRREIRHRVVGAVLQQALVGGVGLVGAEDQRVAVGLGVLHRDAADHAGAAAAIVHRDRLAETVADRLRDQPRRDIDGAAGRVGHDDGDGAARKVLRLARAPRAAASPASAVNAARRVSMRDLYRLRAPNATHLPNNAASKALAIASLLLPGLAASPITVTICLGSRAP